MKGMKEMNEMKGMKEMRDEMIYPPIEVIIILNSQFSILNSQLI